MGGFAAQFTEELRQRGWSGNQFAQLAGVNQSHVSKVLRGVRPPPRAQIEHWAHILGLSPDEQERLILLAALDCTPPEAQHALDQFALAVLARPRGAVRRGVTANTDAQALTMPQRVVLALKRLDEA